MSLRELTPAQQRALADHVGARTPLELQIRLGVQPVDAQPPARPSFEPTGLPYYEAGTLHVPPEPRPARRSRIPAWLRRRR